MPEQCRLCGSEPAADVTFRQHVGMVIFMRARSMPGPFCRDCGIATFRDLQNRTLITGWWGVLSLLVFGWLAAVRNVLALRPVLRLGPPVRDPAATGPLPGPLPPGRPLWMRPGPAVPLLLAAALATVVVVATDRPGGIDPNSGSLIGHCVSMSGETLASIVDCRGPHSGVIVDRIAQRGLGDPCTTGDAFHYLKDGVVLCVDRSR